MSKSEISRLASALGLSEDAVGVFRFKRITTQADVRKLTQTQIERLNLPRKDIEALKAFCSQEIDKPTGLTDSDDSRRSSPPESVVSSSSGGQNNNHGVVVRRNIILVGEKGCGKRTLARYMANGLGTVDTLRATDFLKGQSNGVKIYSRGEDAPGHDQAEDIENAQQEYRLFVAEGMNNTDEYRSFSEGFNATLAEVLKYGALDGILGVVNGSVDKEHAGLLTMLNQLRGIFTCPVLLVLTHCSLSSHAFKFPKLLPFTFEEKDVYYMNNVAFNYDATQLSNNVELQFELDELFNASGKVLLEMFLRIGNEINNKPGLSSSAMDPTTISVQKWKDLQAQGNSKSITSETPISGQKNSDSFFPSILSMVLMLSLLVCFAAVLAFVIFKPDPPQLPTHKIFP
ncbi:hypothetical protein BV898_18409 [Hypsibius exemplaris]|uniref:Uncharacterized protein n=1 Tax=Hypsibius exemplaris TaxID=2072580 RepID=A0A9X6NJP2_HYPEX|nr:hypothetical protein BV898_18409 [Hypsibius exemplaris]